MLLEILPPEGKVKYLGQMMIKHRVRASQSNSLRHRLHLCDAVVTPTITYGARTWNTTEEHEKCSALPSADCFDSTSRQEEKTKLEKIIRDDETSEDTQEEDSTHDEYDQDSSISFDDDEDSTSSQEEELEYWIE